MTDLLSEDELAGLKALACEDNPYAEDLRRAFSHIDALKADIATARTSALKEAAGVAHAFAMRWANKPEPVCESACSAGNEIAAAILALAEVK